MIEAAYWKLQSDGLIQCNLCRHYCRIAAGKSGRCNMRLHRDGRLWSLTYGNLVAEQVDPVEKKPVYHLLPGSRCYSIASIGCSFSCTFCQNHQIAFAEPERFPAGPAVEPAEIIERALAAGCRTLAATYTEPTLMVEYLAELLPQAKKNGMTTILVTNGYMADKPLLDLAPYIDAANIDLKSFRQEFYRTLCGARLDGVLDGIRAFHHAGIWLELTTLLIPGYNDSDEEITDVVRFIVNDLGPGVPWHVSGFYPAYRMQDIPPTPEATLMRACELGERGGLHFVYPGNLSRSTVVTTDCPSCGNVLIERSGYLIERVSMVQGRCSRCRSAIPGIWESERTDP